MGVIVLEGLIVLVLVIVGLREAIMNAVPLALKRAIGVGIGLFILFIGFVDGGLIVPGNPDRRSSTSRSRQPTGSSCSASRLTIVLFVLKVRAALLISIVVMSIVAYVLGLTVVPENLSFVPDFSTLGDFNVTEVWELGILVASLTIFSIMLTDFFDTMGTATAIAEQAGLATPDGKVPGINRVLLVDSFAAAAGGAAGISSNTSYIESAAGVAEGGRTGLTSVIVGILFLLAVLVTPLASMVPFAATGPVLVVVGYLMATLIKDIDFSDVEVGIPALLAITLMPLTYSITVGIGADVRHVRAHQGRARQVRRSPLADVGRRGRVRDLLRAGVDQLGHLTRRSGSPDQTDAPGRSLRPGVTVSGVNERRLRVDDFDYELPARGDRPDPGRAARRVAAARPRPRDRARSSTRAFARHRPLARARATCSSSTTRASSRPGCGGAARRRSRRGARPPTARGRPGSAGRRSCVRRDGWRSGSFVTLRSGDRVEVGERLADGTRVVRFERDAHAVMADAGEMPLPPYIRDRSSPRRALPDGLRTPAGLGRRADRRTPLHR